MAADIWAEWVYSNDLFTLDCYTNQRRVSFRCHIATECMGCMGVVWRTATSKVFSKMSSPLEVRHATGPGEDDNRSPPQILPQREKPRNSVEKPLDRSKQYTPRPIGSHSNTVWLHCSILWRVNKSRGNEGRAKRRLPGEGCAKASFPNGVVGPARENHSRQCVDSTEAISLTNALLNLPHHLNHHWIPSTLASEGSLHFSMSKSMCESMSAAEFCMPGRYITLKRGEANSMRSWTSCRERMYLICPCWFTR